MRPPSARACSSSTTSSRWPRCSPTGSPIAATTAVAVASSRGGAARSAQSPSTRWSPTCACPRSTASALLAHARRVVPDLPVIVMTAYGAVDSAVESIRQGAYHYLTKPFKLDELALFLERALDERRVRREAAALAHALQRALRRVGHRRRERGDARGLRRRRARRATPTSPVLILGETGTGKGLVARAHPRRRARAPAGPFVTVNCAALPEPLLESELFGHVKGAFTGADARPRRALRRGRRRHALPRRDCARCRRRSRPSCSTCSSGGVVRAVGADAERDGRRARRRRDPPRPRASACAAGAFREDLLYRLDVVTIELPPLRHRREDIPLLVEHFLAEARARHPRSPVERLSPEALRAARRAPLAGQRARARARWSSALVLLGRRPEVGVADLPPAHRRQGRAPAPRLRGAVIPIRELQRRYAAWALEQLGGHRTRTAEKLGIDLKTLAKWLRAR